MLTILFLEPINFTFNLSIKECSRTSSIKLTFHVYPLQYLKNGHIITTDIDHFESIDGEVIHWYDGSGLSTTIWFLRPSCGAKKGHSVQTRLKFSASGDYVLCARIYYWNGYSELWIYIGPENQYVSALMTIPNY